MEIDGAEPTDHLTLRGEIDNTSIAELLRSLLQSRETGTLTLHSGEITKTVFLDQGRVVYATSSNPDERLGECLLATGAITVRQFLEASKLIRPGRRLGAILVEMEAIEPDELLPTLEQHVKRILMDLFAWTHGNYELELQSLDTEILPLNLSTENLILDGIRQCRSWSQIQRGVGDIHAVLFPTGNVEVLYKLELSSEEQEILAYVNGRSSVEQICQVSYLSNFETCRSLWAFQVLGLARRAATGDEPVDSGDREGQLDLEDIVERFNQMFNRIYTFLRGRLGEEVDSFVDEALNEVSRSYGSLFAGVDLKHYGRADYEQMLANVADQPALQRRALMVAGLTELVYAIQLAVFQHQGPQERAVISGMIKDGFRRLGQG